LDPGAIRCAVDGQLSRPAQHHGFLRMLRERMGLIRAHDEDDQRATVTGATDPSDLVKEDFGKARQTVLNAAN